MIKPFVGFSGSIYYMNEKKQIHNECWKPAVIKPDGTIEYYYEGLLYARVSQPGRTKLILAYSISSRALERRLSNPNCIEGL